MSSIRGRQNLLFAVKKRKRGVPPLRPILAGPAWTRKPTSYTNWSVSCVLSIFCSRQSTVHIRFRYRFRPRRSQ